MSKGNLHFCYDGYESLLVIEHNFLSCIEIGVIYYKRLKHNIVFNVGDALFDVSGIINPKLLCPSYEHSQEITCFRKLDEAFLDAFKLNLFSSFKYSGAHWSHQF